MTDAVLLDRIHLAETHVSARRPSERPVDAALEILDLPVVGPGDRQRTGEMRVMAGLRTCGFDLPPDLFHRTHPVPVAIGVLGPARREDPGSAVQGIDTKSA